MKTENTGSDLYMQVKKKADDKNLRGNSQFTRKDLRLTQSQDQKHLV